MTDENDGPDVTTPVGQPPPPRPTSAAAAAARRARRIGGPAKAPSAPPAGTPTAAPAEAAPEPAEPVTLAKPDPPAVPAAEPVTEPVWPEPPLGEPAAGSAALLRWLPAVVLIAAAVTMAVLLATFSHSVWWAKPSGIDVQKARNETREQVLAAAKQCVVATNKYNYLTIDADEAAGLKCTTGVQSSRYKRAMDSLIRGPAAKLKASQVPQINTAGIESVTARGTQWTIVVYGQLAIHNANVQHRTDPFAAVVRMDYVRGRWLMSDLQTLQEPGS